MKRLLVAFIFLLNAMAHAETPALVRVRVKLPFEPNSSSAVVLPVGTLVTVLWPQDDKLMVRYRRVEGLVPAVTVNYVVGAHPGDIREFRPESAPQESDSPVAPSEHTANTYHAPAGAVTAGGMNGSFPLSKVVGGTILAVLVMIFASRERKAKDDDMPLLRRQS